jgi:hypothetical protein
MNQFERETLRLAVGLFVLLCISFPFIRYRPWLWSALPRFVMLSCLGWVVSTLVVVGANRMALLQGLLFGFSYLVVVMTSAPLLAAGMFEVMLGLYVSVKGADHKERLPARPHFVAGLSCFGCLGAYSVARAVLV